MIFRAETSAMWHMLLEHSRIKSFMPELDDYSSPDAPCNVYAMGGNPLPATNLVAFRARGAARFVSGRSQGLLT